MELRDWLTIIALILGPILAVQITELLARRKESKQKKLDLFQKLMSTRATRLSPIHVEALNMIDLTFYGEKPVIEAWRMYLDHLGTDSTTEGWNQRVLDLLNDLLFKMSKSVGYDIDMLTIKNVCYTPVAHSQMEKEWNEIRKTILLVLQKVGTKINLDEMKIIPKTEDEKPKIEEVKQK